MSFDFFLKRFDIKEADADTPLSFWRKNPYTQ